MRDTKGRFLKGHIQSDNWYKAMAKRVGSGHSMWKGGQKVEIIDCSCGCGQKLNKYDLRNRISKSIVGHLAAKAWSGKTHTEKSKLKNREAHLGKKHNPEWRLNQLKHLEKQFNNKQPTSIEKVVYDYLILKGILFERQKLINGRFIVDAYIPSLNLVIEADGKYWHNMDRVMKKDKAENAYLTKCGFNLIRLSEEEINSGKFIERMVL